MSRITHLHLQSKHILSMSNLERVQNLRVLYLQENFIDKIEGLDSLQLLTHLYLQHNNISVIENIPPSLNKLYLDDNRISRVEGLETTSKLKELSLAYQRTASEEPLVFAEECFKSFEHCLTVLNLSGNGVYDTSELQGLQVLEKLFLAKNDLTLEQGRDLVSRFQGLEEVIFEGCGMCRDRKYKRTMYEASSRNLRRLDGSPVQPLHRKQLVAIRKKNEHIMEQRLERERQLSAREQQGAGAYQGGMGGFDLTEKLAALRLDKSPYMPSAASGVIGMSAPLSPRSPRSRGSLPRSDSPRGAV